MITNYSNYITSGSSPTFTTLSITNGINMNTTKQINFGSYGAYLCNYFNGSTGYFAFCGGYDTTGKPLDIYCFQNRITCGGIVGRYGAGNYNLDNHTHNFWWSGSNWIVFVDTSQVFNTCDRRIKKNVKPMRNILDRLCNIQMIEYNYKIYMYLKMMGIYTMD